MNQTLSKTLKCIIIASMSLLFSTVYANEFTPIVKQFNKTDYGASSQNWAVGQGEDGTMYFGNNRGLLQFDGTEWELIPLPQNKIARSILVVNNRIYVGSFEEFGYFEKTSMANWSTAHCRGGLRIMI